MVTSRDSPRSDVSPLGLALTTVSAFWFCAPAAEQTSVQRREVMNAILIRMVSCEESESERVIGGRANRLQRSALEFVPFSLF